MKYLGATIPPVDDKAFDDACGVGESKVPQFPQRSESVNTGRPVVRVLKSSGASSPGFSITPEELDARVRAYLDSPTNADQVNAGWSAISRVTGTMRQSDSLRWVAPLDLKSAVEKAYTERFGTKEEATKKAKAQAEQAKKVSPSLGLFQGQMDRLLSACILTISLRCL